MANRQDLYLCEINGGNLRNAIPREAYAICAVPEDAKHDVRTELNIFTSEVENELAVTEPDLKLVLESETPRKMAIDQDTTTRLLKALYAAPHGVYAMSQDIPGLVETSTNLASVKMKPNHIIRIETSQRSSILSARNDMANTVRAVFQLADADVTFGIEKTSDTRAKGSLACMEAESSFSYPRSGSRILQTTFRCRGESESNSRRTGMRSVPRQVSDFRYDLFRTYSHRSTLSRRTDAHSFR